MSIMCSICQDFLTERPQTLTPTDDLVICTLRCGHLFHSACLERWFAHQNTERRTVGALTQNEGNCPCCKKCASLSTAIRVYPTGDEESNSIVDLKKNLDAATVENEKLTTELDEANQLLQRVSSELEEEIVAHDMLKMEYGQALSKIQSLQEQVSDNLKMREVLESSVKTEMEKLEKDKKEALRTIMEMESREKQLIKEMESLRVSDKENIESLFQKGQVPQQVVHTRENVSVPKLSRSPSIIFIKSGSGETSDGDSPNVSPSAS